jgi:hypothetical protein
MGLSELGSSSIGSSRVLKTTNRKGGMPCAPTVMGSDVDLEYSAEDGICSSPTDKIYIKLMIGRRNCGDF